MSQLELGRPPAKQWLHTKPQVLRLAHAFIQNEKHGRNYYVKRHGFRGPYTEHVPVLAHRILPNT